MINKKGMTLVELLVYMVLAALVLAPVIMLMNNSSVSMARDAGRTNLHMSGREIMQIIYDDLKNTGYKMGTDVGGGFSEDRMASNFGDGIAGCYNPDKKPCRFSSTTYIDVDGDGVKDDTSGCTDNISSLVIGNTYCEITPPDNVFEKVRDSSSFYNNSGYIFTSKDEYIYYTSNGGSYRVKIGVDSGSYTGTFPIRRYDTLGVRMVKLGENANGIYSKGVYRISYKVQDTTNLMLIRKVVSDKDATETVLAKNVVALKFRFSDNLKDWYDYFSVKSSKDHVLKRKDIQYIKVILVLRDPKKLSATNPAQPITLIAANDVVNKDGAIPAYYKGPDNPTDAQKEIIIRPTDQALYERYEIVVPIPNNGLYMTQQ